jgi:predicted transcriptional regulator of viral defense system
MKSASTNDILDFLEKANLITKVELNYLNGKDNDIDTTYYASHKFFERSDYSKAVEIATRIYPRGYLSLYSAVYANGLTNDIPKKIYINSEQNQHLVNNKDELDFERIHAAFSKTIERGNDFAEYNGYIIRPTNGMFSGQAGITTGSLNGYKYKYTNLERTLIDIAVRPNMSGGIAEIAAIYKIAVNNFDIRMNWLLKYLDTLNFTYPYEQAIGFLLELAGYKGKLDKMHERISEHKFFLHHSEDNRNLSNLLFNEKWNIYFPKNL